MNTVFGVYKQTDLIEGKGGMVLDRMYAKESDAWNYANRHTGIMGRGPKGSGHSFCPGWQCKQCWPYGGDWDVRRVQVHDVGEAFTPTEVNVMKDVRDRLKKMLDMPGLLAISDHDRDAIELAATTIDEILDR